MSWLPAYFNANSHLTTGPFDVHISHLRKKLEGMAVIQTVRGAVYLEKINVSLGPARSVTDPQGRDLVTGTDRSSLLGGARSPSAIPFPLDRHIILELASADNRYRLITVLDPPFGRWTLVPYYLLIFAVVALVCWALALSIASPLRDLARSVDRFGHGELSVRLNSRRQDEIGELARSFDRMAERIGTLLTAERRLLQDVSHELRSPLARMSFAAEARRDENREAAIAGLREEIQRLSDLLTSLLQVTRIEGDPLARKARLDFNSRASSPDCGRLLD